MGRARPETRRAETERVVEAALREEEALRKAGKYPEGLSAVAPRGGLAGRGEADEELRRGVEVRLADQQMILLRLEDIRLQTLGSPQEEFYPDSGWMTRLHLGSDSERSRRAAMGRNSRGVRRTPVS